MPQSSGSQSSGSSGRRGFAAMDPEEQREIAAMGGRAAHESGNAHEFDSEEAAEAGRKGGRAVSRDREHMAEIGRKGGLASHHNNAAFYHEAAAHHHRQAARHHSDNNEEEGERHGEMAHSHSSKAHYHSQQSRGRSSQGDDEGQDYDEESGGRGGRSNRGFAAMDPERQREIASKGGRASHGGRASQGDDEGQDYDEESSGRGGQNSGRSGGRENRGFASMDPERQREIARKGGQASHGGGRGSRDDDE